MVSCGAERSDARDRMSFYSRIKRKFDASNRTGIEMLSGDSADRTNGNWWAGVCIKPVNPNLTINGIM